jgi:uncharacterized small protein (DUF1192 family)
MPLVDDDDRPIPKLPRKLDDMSVAELDAFIAACEGKIAEAQAVIRRKQGARGAADAIFKKKG